MITIEIMGGLGNQLFQIFTLISTSIKVKQPFYFELKTKSSRENRPFYWNTFLQRLNIFITNKNSAKIVYKEPNFHYNHIPEFPTNKTIKLVGYFQSYKYFHENKNTIFKMIDLKKHKQHVLNKFDNDIFLSSVSLHFRIGDYKHIQHCHVVMTIEYYINAIRTLIKDTQKNDWKILCFFERHDTKEVKNNIEKLQKHFTNLTFIEINHDFEDWIQMVAMSLCQHNIIANSTFSWWGAYMNDNDNRVYYPSTWFGPALANKQTHDLFMENWIKI